MNLSSASFLFFLAAAAAAKAATDDHTINQYTGYADGDSVSKLDLDQRSLIARLALQSDKGLAAAKKIYNYGGHSKPIASLLLQSSLAAKIPSGTNVVGRTRNGEEVVATTTHHVEAGETSMLVEYSADSVCTVGGIPNPDTTGCFAESGNIHVGDLGKFQYSYSPTVDNMNGLTLKGLSTKARKKFNDCDEEACPLPTYTLFSDYYDEFDYADQIIEASFDGSPVTFGSKEFDFGQFDLGGRTVAIRWGTVLLNLWMDVVGSLEKASIMCSNSAAENIDSVRGWDEAFFLYTGSKAEATDSGGYLLYSLAQMQCQQYGTCKKGDVAPVNTEIIENLVTGRKNLRKGKCNAVRKSSQRIKTLMTVPLIQGVLKAAYDLDLIDDVRQRVQGQSAVYLASLLPIVNSCSSGNAQILYRDLSPGNAKGASFEVIKAALERSYDCLGVTCADIGGLVTIRGNAYLSRAQACGGVQPATSDVIYDDDFAGTDNNDFDDDNYSYSPPAPKYDSMESNGANVPLALGLSFGVVVPLILAAAVFYYRYKKTGKEFDTATNPGAGKSGDEGDCDTTEEEIEHTDNHII